MVVTFSNFFYLILRLFSDVIAAIGGAPALTAGEGTAAAGGLLALAYVPDLLIAY